MRVLGWVLVWVVLLLGATGYLWTKLRVAWRTSRALGAELLLTEQRLALADVRGQVERRREDTDVVQELAGFAELAVFADASVLGRERAATHRTLGEQRRARRAENLPAWARRVDS